jgi:hypothetical protein
MVAARIAKRQQGARTDFSPIGEKLLPQQAADLVNVGKRSVDQRRVGVWAGRERDQIEHRLVLTAPALRGDTERLAGIAAGCG